MTSAPDKPFEFVPPALVAERTIDLRTELTAIILSTERCAFISGNSRYGAELREISDLARQLLDKVEREFTSKDSTSLSDRQRADPLAAACKVLYIEDNLVNFALVAHIFTSRPNFRLAQAITGEAGLTVAFSEPLDVILLDLNLPDLHGSEVLRQLQENPSTAHVPVIVISADATASQIERLLAAGARDYLIKPFNVQKFLALMDAVVGEIARSDSA